MANKPVLMVIGTECTSPQWEEAWSKWYSEKHLPDMFYSCNAKKAIRYKIRNLDEEKTIARTTGERSQETRYPPYIALYYFDNWNDVKAYYTGAARKPQVEEWNRDWVSKGARIVWRIFYQPLKTWDKGPLVGNKPAIMFIGSECPPELEQKWGKWYNDVHIADFLKMKGIKKAARFKIITPTEADGIVPTQDERTGKAAYAPFLAFYDFDSFEDIRAYYNSDARPALVGDWNKNWGATSCKVLWRAFYEHMKTWEK